MTTGSEKHWPVAWRIARAVVLRTLGIFAIFVVALTAGFVVFAHWVSVMPASSPAAADGIVALTGDEDRIPEAVRLLAQGKAGRLLISGVNKSTRMPQIISMNGAGPEESSLFGCCIDLDKRSLNTEDNATEAAIWARKRGFHSLIVVTSTYHMPRTLIELRQSMPEADLIPYPVKSARMETEWWNDPKTTWVLFKEYLKFVTASARYGANMLASAPSNQQSSQRTINARMD
ncbi:MAG: YdcF family protein [Rhodomicrobium sp.]